MPTLQFIRLSVRLWLWWCWCDFEVRLQAIEPDITHETSRKNVISIEHTASTVSAVFWLINVLPFRERKISQNSYILFKIWGMQARVFFFNRLSCTGKCFSRDLSKHNLFFLHVTKCCFRLTERVWILFRQWKWTLIFFGQVFLQNMFVNFLSPTPSLQGQMLHP